MIVFTSSLPFVWTSSEVSLSSWYLTLIAFASDVLQNADNRRLDADDRFVPSSHLQTFATFWLLLLELFLFRYDGLPILKQFSETCSYEFEILLGRYRYEQNKEIVFCSLRNSQISVTQTRVIGVLDPPYGYSSSP